MRALAEFIMRGRVQASLVALAGYFLPLVGTATVGLVTLRRNTQDGIIVLMWAGLPLIATFFYAASSPLVPLTSIVGLITLMIGAGVLKNTASWQLTLAVILASCSLGMLIAGAVIPAEITQVTEQTQLLITETTSTPPSGVSPFIGLMAITALGLGAETIGTGFVLGFLAWLAGLNAMASLLLARWWQSLLYNPGGFQEEFHNLRLSSPLASVLLLAVIACNVLTSDYLTWASMLGLPLLLSGISLGHAMVKASGKNVTWLVFMYIGLVLIGPLSMVLIAVGFLDSFLNFRSRFDTVKKNTD